MARWPPLLHEESYHLLDDAEMWETANRCIFKGDAILQG